MLETQLFSPMPRPQREFLSLLNLGDGTALGIKRGIASEGRWVMRLKDRIDRAAKGACDNKMVVRRRLAEKIILAAVRDRLNRTEHIGYLLERVEEEGVRLYAQIPETVRVKETELGAEERRLANFVDFIGEGRGSQALAKALVETERRVEVLREELDGLRRSREKVFQAPPVEWIEERLAGMQKVLERRPERSALLLRSLLGGIQLEPTCGEIGRPS